MEKDFKSWLTDVVLRHAARRLAVAALLAVVGIMADAQLLDGGLVDALQRALGQ